MRHLTALLCLVALASADKLGYNYHPVAHADTAASNVAPSFAAEAPVVAASAPEQTYAPQPELEKEFYSFTANEGDFYDPAASDQVANSLKKALRVIFIKGPEQNGLEDAAAALAKQAGQQETAIYVLNKQADIGDLANRLNAVRGNNNNKPEVHFVKYRTPEDAAHAQHAIQAQYDQLGGASSNHDGGVASSINFASQPAAPAQHYHAASAPAASVALPAASAPEASVVLQPEAAAPVNSYIPPATPGSSYLPANILRLFRL